MNQLFEEFMRYLASSEESATIINRLFAEADRNISMQIMMVNCFNMIFRKWLFLRETRSALDYAREIEECVRDGYD